MEVSLKMGRHRICPVDTIPPGTGIRVQLEDREVALFRTRGDRFFALENRCPHREGPISEGMLSGNTLICPLHSMRIDLATGTLSNGADEGAGTIKVFRTELKDGYIWICE